MEMKIKNNNRVTICDVIVDYMKEKADAVATLKELYKVVKEKLADLNRNCPTEETIRAAIYKAPSKYSFKRIGKGLYLYEGEKTSSLLIHGDGRKLEELDDNSIDFLVTDHPWEDKKAHRSGNQKDFSDYEVFEYTLEDFEAKARVLKEGCYLAEFLPVESATNWKYLTKIKEMATKAGFQYYCQTIWRNAPEGAINTGRTTKGVQQILVFTKGKPRRLSPKGKPYMTKNMLAYEIDIPANKGKEKHHQAEKPVSLYEYLISQFTDEYEVCLDQFGGSCNLLEASVSSNRWGIAYEKCKEFVHNAAKRFKLFTLFKGKDETEIEENSEEKEEVAEIIKIKNIQPQVTDFQLKHLKKCMEVRANLFSTDELDMLKNILKEEDIYSCSLEIDMLFNSINKKGYTNYRSNSFDITLEDFIYLNPLYEKVDAIYEQFDSCLKSYYLNVKLELNMFMEYAVIFGKKHSFEEIINDKTLVSNYMGYLKNKNVNTTPVNNIIQKYLYSNN